MASLIVIKGPDRGKRFQLTGVVQTIGRDAKSDCRLHDTEISRQHAQVHRDGDAFVLSDMQSSNGTLVNGDPIASAPLRPGDRVRIGQTEMIFTADAPSGIRPTESARRISMVSSERTSQGSEIVRSIAFREGSQYLRQPSTEGSAWLVDSLAKFEILYESSRAIARIRDIEELLVHIMELAFKSIKADRGCVVLKDADTGELSPTAVRYAPGINTEENITLSRTIIEWVLTRKEGVIVFDATHDQRFADAASVVRLGIREAMCVPLTGRHETLGVLYVDTKADPTQVLTTQQPTKFTDDHLKLMIAIAHQAGLAIEDSRYYQAMLQAERLAAVGQTIAMLSHHIKNILQGVKSGSYLIELGLQDKNLPLLEQGWTVVQKNQDKIYNLVMDMLSFSKDREPAFELVDLNGIAREVVELMEPRARELEVCLESALDESLPAEAVDPDGVHRALLNIVTNAIDACEGKPASKVRVETGIDLPGDQVWLAVADTGVGIPAGKLEGIFQIFQSTKGARGSGLGLAVSRKIIQEHGGDIEVSSVVGEGSRFVIRLPHRPTLPSTMDGSQTLVDAPADSFSEDG